MSINKSSQRRRECFDDVADLYDKARPGYPADLLRDLIELTGVGPGRRILEIGCGTAQLTVPLAQTGASLVAVELGANLARIARQKLSSFSDVEVHIADFDTLSLPPEPFDLVVAATAFPWLDPATRVEKCAHTLRRGGMLAIIDTHWGIGSSRDEFSLESQACYARWGPNHQPGFALPTLNDLPKSRDDLAASSSLERACLKRYSTQRQYTAEQYCDLLGTFSDVRALNEEHRHGFLSCIRNLINSQFGERITRHDVYDLWTARTSASASLT
jgi:ubiquinone/menaquinone biosynthesis C-methylase UbiE